MSVVTRSWQVKVGDPIRATVAALDGGFAMLGWRGAVFAAKAPTTLHPGSTYDFVVVRTTPHVELALAPSQLASSAAAASDSLHSPTEFDLVAAFVALARSLGGKSQAASSPLAEAGSAWAKGNASANVLATIVRGLGHDHEARVLRLGDSATTGRVVDVLELRRDAKAIALLAQDDAAILPQDRAAATALVHGLGVIERDNAMRADAGLPLWVPLPACPQMGLLDARMFVSNGERDASGGERDEANPFTIVLLLDFTKLGAMRVDVAVEGKTVRANFACAQEPTAASLHAAMPLLTRELEAAGLAAPDLRVQRVVGGEVPVADLALVRRDGEGLVDVQA